MVGLFDKGDMRMSATQRPAAGEPLQGSASSSSGPVRADVLFSRFVPTGIFGKIRNFPLMRILLAICFIIPVLAINAGIVYGVISNLPEPAATYVDIARMVLTFFALMYMWRAYCRIIEKREAYELGTRRALPEFLLGVILALSVVGTTVFIFFQAGIYQIGSFNAPLIIVSSLATYMTGSLMQEIVARLIVYRLTEEFLGTWAAIAISALFFGIAHAANPNQTALSTFNLIITSFLFIGPFMLSRRVWMVLGMHFGWNFTQTGIFGMPNSGIPIPGYITPIIDGPDWLTGGSVGIENSVLTVGLSLVLSAILMVVVIRRGQIVKPRWRRG
jgi:membrane protease YdiL (CAAX protease family)